MEFVDAESFTGDRKEGLTFQQIALYQLSRITKKQSVEFTGGYWNKKTRSIGSGQVTTDKWYVPDTRDEFVNSVCCLRDLLCAYFDQQAEEEVSKFEQEEELYSQEREQNIISEIVGSDNKYNRDTLKDRLKDDMAEYYRKLFRILCKLLKRLGYLEGQTFEESL